jgi:hypothetical protein
MWTGWLWLGARWLDVCQGRGLDVCSRRLHAEAEARGVVGNTRRAMTGGGRPTWTPSAAGQDAPAAPPGPAHEQDDFGAG